MANHRKRGKRGYRLHDERIAYSDGNKSIRTIKYELVGKDKDIISETDRSNKNLVHVARFFAIEKI